jgi:hypothetical protein
MEQAPGIQRSKKQSKAVIELKIRLNITRDFLSLIQQLDALPNMKKVPYDVTRSIYQAVSKGKDMRMLGNELEGFFGPPIKPAGQPMSLKMRFNPAIKYLRGLRDEQALYTKKTKNGFYYGALWPWYKKKENITVHLGYCSNKMSAKDFAHFERLVKTKALNQKLFNEFDAVKGSRIHGIGLGSFLLMAQFEKITCTLEVVNKGTVGYLHLQKGQLVSAQVGVMKNKAAAFEIVSWDETRIDILESDGKRTDEIKLPVTEILAEALRKRKDLGLATGGPAVAATTRPGEMGDRYRELRDMAAEPEKRFPRFAMRITGMVIVLALGVFFTTQMMKTKQIKKEYESVLAQLDEQNSPDDQKVLLQFYINSHEPSKFTLDAEQRIQAIDQLVEEDAFNTTMDEVEKLPLDENYEQAATALYEEYLALYPDGVHASEIQEKIYDIPVLIDDIDYKKLQTAVKLNYNNRIQAYMGYLVKHPTGRHKSEVEGLIADMSEDYYAQLMKEIPRCDQQAKWDNCIILSNNFLKYFKDNYRAEEIAQIKLEMEDKKSLAQLMERVKRLGTRYEAAKQILTDYLAENPDTSQANKIKLKIISIEKKLRVIREWEALVAYTNNPQNSLSARMNEIQRYLLQNSSGPYTQKAKYLLAQIDKEGNAVRQQQKAAAQSRKLAAIQAEKRRLANERKKVIAQINRSGNRYIANGDGTFTDTKTGLMWSLLDSYVELGRCQNYESSVQYVRGLKTGGHLDWRVPLGSELAGIYKDAPFFPGESARWYWTSETFVKGYHKKALIVTSKKERVFKRVQMDLNKCGAIRAVRP